MPAMLNSLAGCCFMDIRTDHPVGLRSAYCPWCLGRLCMHPVATAAHMLAVGRHCTHSATVPPPELARLAVIMTALFLHVMATVCAICAMCNHDRRFAEWLIRFD
eukprot:GHRR01027345.1.p1 GENE.GHRR01027345.1~~GHRR01027345.1.p1  ORF type:complete len:105 (+),score=13.46 GHRR01027345.1:452-766(+)